jgi:transglutaminase/protease-like cytokinesis protein 3
LIKSILDLAKGKILVDRDWMIFYWISQNIRFDVDAYFSGKLRHQRSEDVFRSCKGLSDGYATIFKSLCHGAELICAKLDGYAKGYSFELNQTTLSHVNHAWNAVQLNSCHWYLIDPTWGTGHLDANHECKQELESDYFLIRPEQIIYSDRELYWSCQCATDEQSAIESRD